MSWNSYTDNLVQGSNGNVDGAVIFGSDGSVWGATNASIFTTDVLKELASVPSSPEKFQASGISINGKKYRFLKNVDNDFIFMTRDLGSIVLSQTKTAFVIGIQYYGEQDSRKVEASLQATLRIADYLRDNNY